MDGWMNEQNRNKVQKTTPISATTITTTTQNCRRGHLSTLTLPPALATSSPSGGGGGGGPSLPLKGWLVCSSNRKSGTFFPCESRPEPAVARAPSGIPPVLSGVTTVAVLSVCEEGVFMRVVGGGGGVRLDCGGLVRIVEEEEEEVVVVVGGVGVRIVCGRVGLLVCRLGEEEEEEEGEGEGGRGEKVGKVRVKGIDPRSVEVLGTGRRLSVALVELESLVVVVPGKVPAEVWVSDVVGVVVVLVIEGGGAWRLLVFVTRWVGVVCVSVANVGSGTIVV